MEGNYEIRASIRRKEARQLLADLATDDDFRERVQNDARAALSERGIEIEGMIPEPVKLPSKREIAHLLYTGDSVVPEEASPFGWLVLFLVFGAMPVTTGGRPAADGAG